MCQRRLGWVVVTFVCTLMRDISCTSLSEDAAFTFSAYPSGTSEQLKSADISVTSIPSGVSLEVLPFTANVDDSHSSRSSTTTSDSLVSASSHHAATPVPEVLMSTPAASATRWSRMAAPSTAVLQEVTPSTQSVGFDHPHSTSTDRVKVMAQPIGLSSTSDPVISDVTEDVTSSILTEPSQAELSSSATEEDVLAMSKLPMVATEENATYGNVIKQGGGSASVTYQPYSSISPTDSTSRTSQPYSSNSPTGRTPRTSQPYSSNSPTYRTPRTSQPYPSNSPTDRTPRTSQPYSSNSSSDIAARLSVADDTESQNSWAGQDQSHQGVSTTSVSPTSEMSSAFSCGPPVPPEVHLWRPPRIIDVPFPLTVPAMCVTSSVCRVTTVLDRRLTVQVGDQVRVTFPVTSGLLTGAVGDGVTSLTLTLHRRPDGSAPGGSSRNKCGADGQPTALEIRPNSHALIPDELLKPGHNWFHGRVNFSSDECFTLLLEVKPAHCSPAGESVAPDSPDVCSGRGHCVLIPGKHFYECLCCAGAGGRFCGQRPYSPCSGRLQCSSNTTQCEPGRCTCHTSSDVSAAVSGSCADVTSASRERRGTAAPRRDICNLAPCRNGATCRSLPRGQFHCHCARGYVGATCQVRVLPLCTLHPCYNGGTCTDMGTAYHCACTAGHSGRQCKTVLPGYTSMMGSIGGSGVMLVGPGRSPRLLYLYMALCVAVFVALLTLCFVRCHPCQLLDSCLHRCCSQLEQFHVGRRMRKKTHRSFGDEHRRVLLELGVSSSSLATPMGGAPAAAYGEDASSASGLLQATTPTFSLSAAANSVVS